MHLTFAPPPEDFERALESWSWIDIADKRPLFGDVFFEAADGCWYLDLLEAQVHVYGSLQLRSHALDEFIVHVA